MNLLVNNYLILLGLRSFSAISCIWSCILFHESMALTGTENFPKLFVLKDFLWRWVFYVNRILKYLCLKHDFSFIDQINDWTTLPNGDLNPSLFFKDSLHLIEEGSVKLAKLIINSIVLRNNKCFSSNTGKRYSYSDNCKIKLQFLLL